MRSDPARAAVIASNIPEVSDKIEKAVQQLGRLKEVESKSDRGLSTVTVRIKDKYDKNAPPQGPSYPCLRSKGA